MATPTIDPWLDEDFRLADNSNTYFEELPRIAQEEGFVEPAPEPVSDLVPEPVAAVPEPTPAPEPEPQPSTITDENGVTVTIDKRKGQWYAEVDTHIPGTQPERFYGKTKDELLTRLALGKGNATKRVRELDRKVKLGEGSATSVPIKANAPKKVVVHDLTADEAWEYKTLFESNPVAAQDYYYEKRFGLSPQEVAQKLNEVTLTHQLADISAAANAFVQQNPDYYPTQRNFYTVVRYLVKKSLGRAIQPDEDMDQLTIDLLERGVWTVEHLEQAKDDLLASELLEVAPQPPAPRQTVKPVPEPQPPVPTPTSEPVPAPAVPPVDNQQPAGRTRAANFGIRVTGGPALASPEQALPDEDVNNWSDDVVESAMRTYRLNRQKNGR